MNPNQESMPVSINSITAAWNSGGAKETPKRTFYDVFRWKTKMATSYLQKEHWRKSQQWFILSRDHAELAVKDQHVKEVFKRHIMSISFLKPRFQILLVVWKTHLRQRRAFLAHVAFQLRPRRSSELSKLIKQTQTGLIDGLFGRRHVDELDGNGMASKNVHARRDLSKTSSHVRFDLKKRF